jgi:hypothetical protein
LSATILLSTGTFGRWRAFEPVAMITFFAVTTSVSPSPLTSICTPASVRPVNLPWPLSHVILFLRNRNSMPFVIFSTMPSLRAIIFVTSILTSDTLMPWSTR